MSRGKRILFSLVAAFLVLAALELVLRLLVPRQALLFSWERADSLIALTNTGLVESRPGRVLSMQDGPYRWEVRTNSLGLREDRELPRRIPPGTRRILALGDSWVYGFSVTQGKTLSDQLEALLPASLGVDRVEVLNAGIPGGSGFEMLVQWHRLTAALEIDGLLLGIPHNLRRQGEVGERRARWYASVRGAPFIDLRIYLVMRRLIAPRVRPRYAAPVGPQDSIRAMAHDLVTITREARARGLPVWAIDWPVAMDEALKSRYQLDPQWAATLGPLGVPIAGHALDARECWGFRDHGHPGEAGHRAVAEVVAALVAEGRLEPAIRDTPRCAEVPGLGPGKPGAPPWSDDGLP